MKLTYGIVIKTALMSMISGLMVNKFFPNERSKYQIAPLQFLRPDKRYVRFKLLYLRV